MPSMDMTTAPMVMATTVLADRVLIGPEFVPRRLDLPSVLQVPAGQTVDCPTNGTFDYIEVAGTLHVSRMMNTTISVTTLVVLPGGYLDAGTVASPLPANITAAFTVRNVPIDTTKDPFHWGNGLLNFGKWTFCGAQKAHCCDLAVEAHAGDMTITLADAPTGWQIDDELVLQDTAQTVYPALPRRESPVFVAAISGMAVTLSKGLDFDHFAIKRPDGSIKRLGCACNESRNIKIVSEDWTGTPGHLASVGADTSWDVRYTEHRNMGRTKNIGIDSTLASATGPATFADPTKTLADCVAQITHIGTNQIAKYNNHFHHAQGNGSVTIGNVWRGAGVNGVSGKWGLSVHQTHDTLVQQNIADGFPGAGLVTEDGPEIRNVIDDNVALYCLGNHTDDANIESGNAEAMPQNPGAAGNGFWLRGTANTITKNEASCCCIGMNLFNIDQAIPSSYPSMPGGPLDTTYVPRLATPILLSDNAAFCNTFKNLEYWGVPDVANVNMALAYAGILQFFQSQSGPAIPHFTNISVVGFNGQSRAFQSGVQYAETFTLHNGGEVVGCLEGIKGGGIQVVIDGPGTLLMQNVTNILWDDGNFPINGLTHVNVMHKAMPGLPEQFIVLGGSDVWNGTLPLPVHGSSTWAPQRGCRYTFTNWQGTGQSGQFLLLQQIDSAIAWPSYGAWPDVFNVPEIGLTNAQAWATYGMSNYGDRYAASEVVTLEGVTPGVARIGVTTYSPPHAVMTWPMAGVETPVVAGPPAYVQCFSVLTGDPNVGGSTATVSIDGGTPFALQANVNDELQFQGPATAGSHTVQTWRNDPTGNPMGDPLTFTYEVGPVVPPTTVMVPALIGMSEASAGMALTATGLVQGTVTSANSNMTPAGIITGQMPAAGAQVAPGSTVAFTVSSGPAAPLVPPPLTVMAPQGTYTFTFDSSGHSVTTFVPAKMM